MSETTPETPEETEPHVHMHTAFLVVVDPSGKAYAVLQVPDGVAVNYLPDVTSVRRACLEIAADINAHAAAEHAVTLLAAQANAGKTEKPSDAVAEGWRKRKGKKG